MSINLKSKIIALYLPQFYEIKENNEWWGNGYTDWVAVKNSKPYFKGHNQPRVPLNQNYYRLDSKDTIKWQAELAKKYGVDGFCIYHYFSNGKLMMNKPAEVLRDNNEIDIEYFFSWANHDFKRQWFDGDGKLLRKQEYGDEETWKEHFNYLLQFFNDSRYIKIDNKPIFVIYDTFHIKEFSEMMTLWNQWAREEGFNGIFIIGTKSNTNLKSEDLLKLDLVNATFVFEPMNFRTNGYQNNYLYTTYRRVKTVTIRLYNKLFKNNTLQEKYSIKKAYKAILNRSMLENEYYGFFTDWDNTPRYKGKSIVFTGAKLNLFEEYFYKVYKKSCESNKPFIFINAWNEWGESAYLEPDEENEYSYLEIIKKVKKQMR